MLRCNILKAKLEIKKLEYPRADNWWNDGKILIRNNHHVLSLKSTQLEFKILNYKLLNKIAGSLF